MCVRLYNRQWWCPDMYVHAAHRSRVQWWIFSFIRNCTSLFVQWPQRPWHLYSILLLTITTHQYTTHYYYQWNTNSKVVLHWSMIPNCLVNIVPIRSYFQQTQIQYLHKNNAEYYYLWVLLEDTSLAAGRGDLDRSVEIKTQHQSVRPLFILILYAQQWSILHSTETENL